VALLDDAQDVGADDQAVVLVDQVRGVGPGDLVIKPGEGTVAGEVSVGWV